MSPKDLDTSDYEIQQFEELTKHAAEKNYADLLRALDETGLKLQDDERSLTDLRIKLDEGRQAIAMREAQLAFEPSLTVEGDPPLKRLKGEQDRLSRAFFVTRLSVQRSRLLQRVAREEMERRAQILTNIVTERVFAQWKQDDLEKALSDARAAVVHAMLTHCGHTTERPAFVSADGFMRHILGFREIQRMAEKCEEDERHRQRALVVEDDKYLG